MKAILARKLEMTQVYDDEGNLVPVTALRAGPCVVVQVKTLEKDGYRAAQIGLVEPFSARKWTKPLRGHVEKAGVPPVKALREVRLDDDEDAPAAGEAFLCDVFEPGDVVTVTGTAKGKGFQGVMRRHGFSGGGAAHGSMFHRAPGAIGMSADPSRVIKGKRMPGQMGAHKVTVKNLEIVQVDGENDLLLVKGGVPGARESLLLLQQSMAAKAAAKEA